MSKFFQELEQEYKNQRNMDAKGMLSRDINDFESYYKKLQNGTGAKAWYRPQQFVYVHCENLQNELLKNYESMKQGKFDEEKTKDFNDLLDTIKNDNNSHLKKMMRTVMLDIYDTLAGDLDNKDNKDNLKKVVALSDLYDRILNANDKQNTKGSFENGEAQNFLSNDKEMNGNFSKTLKALYRKYQNAENEAEKAKWKKVCNSYAIRPYMQVIEKKVKQEDFEALPEETKKRILEENEKQKAKEKQLNMLRDEAKTLNQDPEAFVKLSVNDRNNIRKKASEDAYVPNKIAKLQALVNQAENRYRDDHDYLLYAPSAIARKSAYFERSSKDSEYFKRMFDSLNKLRNTDGYHQMDTLLSEGNSESLVENLNNAITDTQNYITYANQKTVFQKGIVGTKRLKAAEATLQKLTDLQQFIQSEQKFMQDTKKERQSLEALKKTVNAPLDKTGMDFAPKPEPESDRLQMTVKDLSGDVGNKKTNKILSDWTVVEAPKEKKNAAAPKGPAK